MPRRARFTAAGVPAHVIQRGNNRRQCFFDESDRHVYLHHLTESAAANGCEIHAYVLMPNHSHILMTPASDLGLAQTMKRLGQRYTQFVNRKYRRTGTLWDGRFKSSLILEEPYLFRCYRYIELNPVRAGLVASPFDFRWSSHRANAFGIQPDLVTPRAEFTALAVTEEERRAAYRALFLEPLTQEQLTQIRLAARGGFALGVREDFPAARRIPRGRRPQQAAVPESEKVVCPRPV